MLGLPERTRSLVDRSPRLAVEHLEDRVLLSQSTILNTLSSDELVLGSSSAKSTASIADFSSPAPAFAVLTGSVVSIPSNQSLSALIDAVPASDTQSSIPSATLGSAVTAVSSNPVGNIGISGSSVAPPDIAGGVSAPPIGDFGTTTGLSQNALGLPVSPPTDVAAAKGSNIGLGPGDLAVAPLGGSVQVEGTLDSAHSSEIVEIMVGPATESLAINLKSMSGLSSNETAVVSRLFLVDAAGQVVAQWAPDTSGGESAPQSVNVALTNAPLGGRLLVEISTESNPDPAVSAKASGMTSSLATESASSIAMTPSTTKQTDASTERVAGSDAANDAVPVTASTTATRSATETGTNSETQIAVESAGGSEPTIGTATTSGTVTNTGGSGSTAGFATSSGTVTSGGTSLDNEVITPPSQQAANWSLSFLLDIQLQEQSAPTTPAATATEGPITIGTLTVAAAASGQSGAPPDLAQPSTTADASVGTSISERAVADGLLTTSSGPDQSAELSDSFNERVPTGPFASRSAGPLGPNIAASMSDPTSPVDRHERALFQDMEGLGIENETATPGLVDGVVNVADQQPILIEAEPRSSEKDEDRRLVVVVSGRGGFPLKVTAPPNGQRVSLAALLAVLPDSSDKKSEIPLASSEDLTLDEFSDALGDVSTSQTDRPEFPDYVKAACGLAIGLGLTSGPLFPDLMQSLRSRIPKWMIGHRGRGQRENRRDSNG